MARKFLKPLAALTAALLSSTLQSHKADAALQNADAALQNAVEKASKPTPTESAEGRPDPDPLTLWASENGQIQLDHYSHSSHRSHRSHYSGYTD